MNKEIYFWTHSLLLIAAYLSPFWVDWRIIIVGVVILHIQYWVIRGCVLTHLEMGEDKNHPFLWYYLKKIYPSLDPQKTRFVIRIVLPIFLIVIGFVLQNILGLKPLLHF